MVVTSPMRMSMALRSQEEVKDVIDVLQCQIARERDDLLRARTEREALELFSKTEKETMIRRLRDIEADRDNHRHLKMETDLVCRQKEMDTCLLKKQVDELLCGKERDLKRVSTFEGEVSMLRERLISQTHEHEDLISTLRNEYQILGSESFGLKEKIHELEQQLRTQKIQANLELGTIAKTGEASTAVLQRHIIEAESLAAGRSQQLSQIEKTLFSTETDLRERDLKVTQLSNRMAEKEKIFAATDSELRTAKQLISELEVLTEKQRGEIASYKSKHESAQEALKSLMCSHTTSEAQFKCEQISLADHLEASQREITLLKMELERGSEEIKTRQTAHQQLQKTLEDHIEKERNRVTSATVENESLRKELLSLKTCSAEQETMQTSRIVDLELQLSNSQQCESENIKLKCSLDQLESRMTNTSVASQQQVVDITNLEQQLSEVMNSLTTEKESHDLCKSQLSTLQETTTDLNTEVIQLRPRACKTTQLEDEQTTLVDKCCRLEAELSEQISQLKQQQRSNEVMAVDKERYQIQVTELLEQIKTIEQLGKQQLEAVGVKQSLERDVASLQGVLDSKQREIETLGVSRSQVVRNTWGLQLELSIARQTLSSCLSHPSLKKSLSKNKAQLDILHRSLSRLVVSHDHCKWLVTNSFTDVEKLHYGITEWARDSKQRSKSLVVGMSPIREVCEGN